MALLAGGVAALSSSSASAQTALAIAVNPQSVVLHYTQDGKGSSHAGNAQPTWISHQDCEQNVYLAVPLVVTGSPLSYPIQTWATASGADCTDPTQRTGTTSQCWQVANPVAPTTALTININSQDIVQYITTPSGQKPAGFTRGNTTGCDSFSTSGPVGVSLYFMFIDSSGTLQGTDATYALSVALIGPAAPTGVSILPGDTFIKAQWTPTTDANTQGFNLYCDPPPGKEQISDSGIDGAASVVDAGQVLVCRNTTEDGGLDDAGNPLGDISVDAGCHEENQSSSPTSTSGNCVSSEIISGGGTVSTGDTTDDDSGIVDTTGDDEGGTVVTGATPPPANIGDYLCGSVGAPTANGATLQGLKNGVEYVVGVAAVDVVGNIGPMSQPGCETPTKGLDFFDEYQMDGGGAGGGFCSVDKTAPVGTSAFVFVGIASLISVVRRKKQKSKQAGKDTGS